MSKLASIIIADVKDDFEGGSSLSVNWDNMLRRGVEAVLDKIKPKTLNRSVPITGGVTEDQQYYDSPDDILVPIGIFDKYGAKAFSYYPPKQFREKVDSDDIFTIEIVNGLQRLRLRKDISSSTVQINDYSALTTGGLMKYAVTNALFSYGTTYSVVKNISEYVSYDSGVVGSVLNMSVYIEDVSKLSTMYVDLRTNPTNYYRVTLNTAELRNGQNYVTIDLENKTTALSPNPASIASWTVNAQAITGQTVNVIFGKISLQSSTDYSFVYCSNRAFIDGTTGVWKDGVVEDTDYVNFDRDILGILHYEMCVLVDQATTKRRSKNNGAQVSLFVGQLKTKYAQYWEKFPSEEEPLSYSISPEIAHSIEGEPRSYNFYE